MKRIISISINNYPDSENNLHGCLNDEEDWKTIFTTKFGFDEHESISIQDDQCTRRNILDALKLGVQKSVAGDILVIQYSGHGCQVRDRNDDEPDRKDEALYVYDGPLIDDELGEVLSDLKPNVTCVVILDSCFSGTATRGLHLRNRCVQIEDVRGRRLRRRFLKNIPGVEMKWIVLSGCSEMQTSADAMINDRYNGAFTFFALLALKDYNYVCTYNQWLKHLRKYLPSKDFEQKPTLEGPESLLNKQIFTES